MNGPSTNLFSVLLVATLLHVASLSGVANALNFSASGGDPGMGGGDDPPVCTGKEDTQSCNSKPGMTCMMSFKKYVVASGSNRTRTAGLSEDASECRSNNACLTHDRFPALLGCSMP